MDKRDHNRNNYHNFNGYGRPHFYFPPPHAGTFGNNGPIASQQNDANFNYRKHWNASQLPHQQMRYGPKEDAQLRDDLRRTRRRLSEMGRRIHEFENQLCQGNKWQPPGARRPFDVQGQSSNQSQINPEALKEPDVHSWLAQQRENCELWNQNISLKESLRNVGQENNALREMCRQKEVNISILEKKTSDLKAELKSFNDFQQDLHRVSKAFDTKPEAEDDMESFKCTCGQC